MSWQEIVLTFGQVVFTISLLPSILSKDKPALATSVITTTILLLFTLTYTSMRLYLAAAGAFTTGALWGVLAYQKFIIDRRKKS